MYYIILYLYYTSYNCITLQAKSLETFKKKIEFLELFIQISITMCFFFIIIL